MNHAVLLRKNRTLLSRGLRCCSGCERTLPVDQFYQFKGKPTGRCRECAKEYARQSFNLVEYRQKALEKQYGISLEEYESMLMVQGGGCAICGTAAVACLKGRLAVDHDHQTGKVRALLCGMCNMMLGHVKDSVERLEAMIAYLKKHKSV